MNNKIFLAITSILSSFFSIYQMNKITDLRRDLTLYECKILQMELNALESKKMALTWQNVDMYIDMLPFKDKELVKRQYKLETGNLTSRLCMNQNNLFGMKASSRKHSYTEIDNGYAVYEHWTLSVIDRLLYDIYVGNSLENYAEDENYLKKLKK